MRISDWSSDVCSSDLLEASGCGLSRFVSGGSELDLRLSDFIRYLAQDDETRVSALILDHVGDGQAFIDAVREARRAGKEIVALKLGNSDLGQEATLAHSSHLSGKKQVYDAVFARYGVRQTPTVERSEEHTSELQSLMRISYAVFCL